MLPVVSLPEPVCWWLPFPAFFVFFGFRTIDPRDPKQEIKSIIVINVFIRQFLYIINDFQDDGVPLQKVRYNWPRETISKRHKQSPALAPRTRREDQQERNITSNFKEEQVN